MKRILTILLVFAATLPVAAQQMLVDKSAGSNEVIDLNALKQITFNGTTVKIEQTCGAVSNSDMSDINQITFGDYTAIGEVKERNAELVTYITNDEIAVNCEAGSTVTIYNLIGTQVLTTRINADYGRVNIANLPKGIYIVKAKDKTAKIVRR